MQSLRKKFASFFLFLFVFTLIFTNLPPPVQAQACPPANAPANPNPPNEPGCTAIKLACSIGSDTLKALWNNDASQMDQCASTLYTFNQALFAVVPPAPWYNPSVTQFARKVFNKDNPDEIFGERYTYAQVNWIIYSLVTFIFPPLGAQSIVDLFNYLVQIVNVVKGFAQLITGGTAMAPKTEVLAQYGFIGGTYYIMLQVPKMIFSSRIASGVDEVKIMASKFNIVSPAMAQGLGYDKLGLGTIKSLWVASRNIAYLISTIILIAAGFMVIFRTKISPQVSVTVQMIIPRLAISLVLVTFSFAIAGFIIDMVYVAIAAVLGMISFSTGTTYINDLPQAILTLTGNFDFVGHFIGIYIVIAVLLLLAVIIIPIAAAATPLGVAGLLLAPFILPIFSFIMGFFMWSIYVWARILGQLIVAYITLILLVIAGPIMIIMDILPTSKGGFKQWALCVIGNASVFATYAFLSILSNFLFVGDFVNRQIPGFATSGNIQSGFSMPLFTGGYPRSDFMIQYFIFIGFMSMVPNIAASIKNMFCKSGDLGDFLSNQVKDTVGQITKAGDTAASGVGNYRNRQIEEQNLQRTIASNQARTAATTQQPPGNAPQP